MQRSMRDFALEVHFSKWEFTARYNLAGSDAESMQLRELLALATPEDREAFDALSLGYTETRGAPALRDAIAETYEAIGPGELLCFTGAEEGLYAANQVLLGPGDHAVVLTPNYQSAETIPLSLCDVSGVSLAQDGGWALDLDRLRAVLRPETRLVSINFPNNPTGFVPPIAVLEELVQICREHDLWLFSDEVYRLLERDADQRLPQVADLYEKGISLNVLSKAYGLPGLRIGWLACRNQGFLTRAERFKHYLSICGSAPSEVLARIALGVREKILARTRSVVEENLVHLDSFFSRHENLFDWRRPEGGCVAFLPYLGDDGVEEFTRQLVEESGVLLLPASLFKSELTSVPENYFRVGFGRSFFPEGLGVFEAWLAGR